MWISDVSSVSSSSERIEEYVGCVWFIYRKMELRYWLVPGNVKNNWRQDVGKFLRRVQLKAFFHDKEDDSNTSDDKDTFETLQVRKSKWTPPEGQYASLDYFINKCRHDINKLNFNRNTKFSYLSSEERAALQNLSKRKDIIVKAADKGGALVVWRADLYQKEALRQLSDTPFYAKVDKDLTSANQQIVKSTVNDLIVKQELPATASNLIITTPRTSCIYFLP